MSETYGVGDKVVLVRGEERLAGNLVTDAIGNVVLPITFAMKVDVLHLEANGWEVIEHTPAVALPTEDGWYESERFPLSDDFTPYRRWHGSWFRGDGHQISESNVRPVMPLHNLAREDETAEKVIKWIDQGYRMRATSFQSVIDTARDYFGVASDE